jgi:ComF family protein
MKSALSNSKTPPSIVGKYFQGFADLIYPRLCAACSRVLLFNENAICLYCLADLPRTGFHRFEDNEVERLFWGRVNVQRATSFILFQKGSRYRKILHALKYQNQKQVGYEMGYLFGLELRGSSFQRADVIIPMPLHPSRLHKRGYNQSELIAKGMSGALHIPVETDIILRDTKTRSQTGMSRFERWENIRNSFILKKSDSIINKHILLVDDVITTGATIEACVEKLLTIQGTIVSVASLAFTKLQ